MCGINGVWDEEGVSEDDLIRIRDALEHRGPDDADLYLNDEGTVGLGHRRLSIIDLSDAGSQPMQNEDGTVWLVFNGEIYNYQNLREELVSTGHEFTSGTDSEVILHGYEEWGESVVERLRGMFAFGIYDEDADRLFLARDRVGIKPLYYRDVDGTFQFASEAKGILADPSVPREVDRNAVRHFFKYRYVPEPLSIFKDIRKLPAGHTLTYEDGEASVRQYWDSDDISGMQGDVADAVDDAVRRRTMSDVPLGTLLSGGIDSSVVSAIVADTEEDIIAYTIGFPNEAYDETDYAAQVAEAVGIDHVVKELTERDADSLLQDVLHHYDEPLGDSSVFPTMLLMDTVSDDLKVALSGDGGDEVFGGYVWYDKYLKYQRWKPFSPLFSTIYRVLGAASNIVDHRYVHGVRRRLRPFTVSGQDWYHQVMDPLFSGGEIDRLIDVDAEDHVADENPAPRTRKDMQQVDFRSFLVDDILVKVDRASMAQSLEVRVPLLDHQLVERVFSMDDADITPGGRKKALLKDIAAALLPDAIIEREKTGFSAPLDDYGYISDYLHVLEDSAAVADGVLDERFVASFLDRDLNNVRGLKIWLLVYFELWYRTWIRQQEDVLEQARQE